MALGSRIKAARAEAGLSQKQLCGDQITRNMLSQIENGSAQPSMKTLEYLASRLGRPISYFLEEQAVSSPNARLLADAKTALAMGDLEQMRRNLDAFREPDEIFWEERQLLEYYWHLRRAEQAIREGMIPYGVKLLYCALDLRGLYITPLLHNRCRVLLAMNEEHILPDADEALLLARAKACPDPVRRLEILGAAEDKTRREWVLLQAQALFEANRYAEAAEAYSRTEPGREIYEKLEICYRELGDYKLAYEYACKQRQEER